VCLACLNYWWHDEVEKWWETSKVALIWKFEFQHGMVDKDKLRSCPSLRVWDQIQDTTSVFGFFFFAIDPHLAAMKSFCSNSPFLFELFEINSLVSSVYGETFSFIIFWSIIWVVCMKLWWRIILFLFRLLHMVLVD